MAKPGTLAHGVAICRRLTHLSRRSIRSTKIIVERRVTMTKPSTAVGADLSGLLACVVALEGPARASAPNASAVSVNTPVCSYGRVDVAALDGRPGMRFFLDGAEAFRRKDYHHAIYMYKVAASWADKSGEYDLGLAYFRGEGVPVDRPLGAAWMVLVAERGNRPRSNDGRRQSRRPEIPEVPHRHREGGAVAGSQVGWRRRSRIIGAIDQSGRTFTPSLISFCAIGRSR